MNNILNIHQNVAKIKESVPLFINAFSENEIYGNQVKTI